MANRGRRRGQGIEEAQDDMTAAATPHGLTNGSDPGMHGPAGASPERSDWLSRSLRRLYGGMLMEPIPPTFLELLDELERREEEAESGAGERRNPGSSTD